MIGGSEAGSEIFPVGPLVPLLEMEVFPFSFSFCKLEMEFQRTRRPERYPVQAKFGYVPLG